MLIFKNRKKILVFLLCLVSATIPFLVKTGNMAIILAVIANVVLFRKENLKKVLSFEVGFLVTFFIIAFISSALSKKSSVGFNHLDLVVLLLLIALMVININISKKTVVKVLKWFYIGTVIFTIILILNALINLLVGSEIGKITFHGFTELFDQHPVYYSMYISLALFISISGFLKKEKETFFKPKKQFFYNSILLIGLVLCASKALLVLNLLIYSLFFFFKIKELKKKIGYIIILTIAGVSVFNISFINKRFNDGLRFKEEISLFKPTNDFSKKKVFSYDDKENISDLELRYIFGYIALYHAYEDNKIMFGYKQGDAKDYLNYYFFSYNLGPNWYENYNVHNQYIHLLIVYGIFVLIFFLAYLFYSFAQSIKYKNKVHLFFLTLTCFVFIFEVVLVRNKGIIFFYFFNTLFLFYYKSIENSNIRHKRNPKLSWWI
jgi:O-antigen ligase